MMNHMRWFFMLAVAIAPLIFLSLNCSTSGDDDAGPPDDDSADDDFMDDTIDDDVTDDEAFDDDTIDDDTIDDDATPPVFIDDQGYFCLNGKRTILLGAEEPPMWIVFPALQPYSGVMDDFVTLCRQSHVNLLVLYKWTPWPHEFLMRLAQEGIWLGIQVAEAKQNLFGFSQTGGAIGKLPDEEFQQEQLAMIEEKVGAYHDLPNIAFWWIGGEFVEPWFYFDGGQKLRQVLQRYIDAIHDLDPEGRPITCSQHLLEVFLNHFDPLFHFLDLTDQLDFNWITMATHMHLGDFIPGLSYSMNWLPVLRLMEKPEMLTLLLNDAFRLNHEKAIYLGSWSTASPDSGPCLFSAMLTGQNWENMSTVTPFNGGAYWNLADQIQPSDMPHALMMLNEGMLIGTENLDGLAAGYASN